MADDVENKRVEYSFTGDVSSLRTATDAALKLLDQYEAKIASLTQASNFSPSQKASKSFQANIKGVTQAVEQLQSKMGQLRDVRIPSGTPEATQLRSSIEGVQTVLSRLSTGSKVTTKDVKDMVSTLKASKQGFDTAGQGIEGFVAKEQKFNDTLERISQGSRSIAERLASLVGAFKKPFDRIGSILQSFKDSAASALDRLKQVLAAAGSGFRQFKGDAEDGADGAEDAGEGAENAGNRFAGLSTKVQAAITVLKTIGSVFSTVSRGVKRVASQISSAIFNFDGLKSSVKTLARALSGLKLGDIMGKAAISAMEFVENLNLFTVAMGDTVEHASKFVDRMSEIYGMDPSNLYRYAGYFYQLTDAIGMASKASEVLSLSLTKAANDISSLFNVPVEQVVENLAAGMQGMSRAVRKYGMDIRASTLQQTAFTYGLTQQVSEMSEANRQALRYLTMMQQVKNATKQVVSETNGVAQVMGDFARNIETPANQLRIFKEQTSQLARAIGSFFLPALTRATVVANGFIMAIRTLLTYLTALMGIDLESFGGEVSQAPAESLEAIGTAAEDTAKKLKKTIAPFDELNVLAEESSNASGGGGLGSDLLDPALLAAIEQMQLDLDNVRMKALDVRDALLGLFGLQVDEEGNVSKVVGGLVDQLTTAWDNADYSGFGAGLASFINQGIDLGLKAPSIAPKLQQFVANFAKLLNGFVAKLNFSGLGTLLARGFNTVLTALYTWLTTFDYGKLGAQLATGLNSLIAGVNWTLLGETLGANFMAKVDLLREFFGTFDWANLGSSLGVGLMALLTSINWASVGETLSNLFNGVLDALRNFLNSYEWGTIGSDLALGLSTSIRELNWHNLGTVIGDTARALLREVTNFVAELDWFALGKGITEAITAIDWFGLLTDVLVAVIAVLSAVVRAVLGLIVGIFTGLGTDISEGFKDGIVAGLQNIGNWLYDHLIDPIIRGVKAGFGIHSPSTVFADIGKLLLDGLFQGLSAIGNRIKTWGEDVISKVKDVFGIHSPSKEFEEFGDYMLAGLFNGLEDYDTVVVMFENMLGEMSKAVQNFSNQSVSNLQSVVSMLHELPTGVEAVRASVVSTNAAMPSVASPTGAMFNDGVVPTTNASVGNATQMQDFVSQLTTALVNAQASTGMDQKPIELHVYLDPREVAGSLYDELRYVETRRGPKLVQGGR